MALVSGLALRRAAIIAVGSEMLTPLRIDTNSLFITEQLNSLGIELAFKTIVGDDRVELARAFKGALERVDLVILTGGLGPTDDDVTRNVVADVLQRALHEEPEITEAIRQRFARRGSAMPEINRRQAMVPDGAEVLPNANGTAPGLWIELPNAAVALLPGPPRELKPLMTQLAEGKLRAHSAQEILGRRVIRIAGRTESYTDQALQPLYAEWARAKVPVAATILAVLGQIELHLSARSSDRRVVEEALEQATSQVCTVLGKDVFSTDGRALEEVVGSLLVERGWRISVAESCSGGLLSSRLTDVPGSSRYVDRGVVAYSNEAKTELLDVPASLIATHGAVSEPVAVAMATGIRTRSGSHVGIGVTGIAGPGGGTPEKPVGTVAVAVATLDDSQVRTARYMGDREHIKFQASQAALDMVRRMLSP